MAFALVWAIGVEEDDGVEERSASPDEDSADLPPLSISGWTPGGDGCPARNAIETADAAGDVEDGRPMVHTSVISKRRIVKARRPVVGRHITGCFNEEMEVARPRTNGSKIASSVAVHFDPKHMTTPSEIELARPKTKRSKIASSVVVYFDQICAKHVAVMSVCSASPDEDSSLSNEDGWTPDGDGCPAGDTIETAHAPRGLSFEEENGRPMIHTPVISKRRIVKARRPVVCRCVTGEEMELARPGTIGSKIASSVAVYFDPKHMTTPSEMELARPRTKRSKIASSVAVYFDPKHMAIPSVCSASPIEDSSLSDENGVNLLADLDDESLQLSCSDSEDESDLEDDGSDFYFLSHTPAILDGSGYSGDDDADKTGHDDPTDILADLPPLFISGWTPGGDGCSARDAVETDAAGGVDEDEKDGRLVTAAGGAVPFEPRQSPRLAAQTQTRVEPRRSPRLAANRIRADSLLNVSSQPRRSARIAAVRLMRGV
jgi:hypothetical protein